MPIKDIIFDGSEETLKSTKYNQPIPAICPAIRDPFSTSPSLAAFLKDPLDSSSNFSLPKFSFSNFIYCLVNLFLRDLIGWPVVVDAVDIPVIAAGGIGDGRGMAATFMLGAQGVQIGTSQMVY